MRKKLVIIGVIILIAGIVVSELVTNLEQPPFYTENLTIAANGYNYAEFNFTSTDALFVFESLFKAPMNVYVMNTSAFSSWKSSLNQSTPPNGFAAAVSLEGNGVVGIYKNMSTYLLDYPINYTKNVVYLDKNLTKNSTSDSNLSISASNATYFIVFNNMNGNVSNSLPNRVNIRYIPPLSLSNLQSDHAVVNYIYISGGSLLVSLVLVIAGIVILVIGLIKKPKILATEVPEVSGKVSTGKLDRKIKERDELYKGIKEKKQKKSNE
ncbi:MAG: hypothetical protein ACP5MZ_03155 [Candidatus Micrarchaeia archaeon]